MLYIMRLAYLVDGPCKGETIEVPKDAREWICRVPNETPLFNFYEQPSFIKPAFLNTVTYRQMDGGLFMDGMFHRGEQWSINGENCIPPRRWNGQNLQHPGESCCVSCIQESWDGYFDFDNNCCCGSRFRDFDEDAERWGASPEEKAAYEGLMMTERECRSRMRHGDDVLRRGREFHTV